MNLKWLLILFPITALVTTFLSRSQNIKVVPANGLNTHINIQKAGPDSIKAIAPAYNMKELKNTGWLQLRGQMPVFIPDSALTDAMPVHPAPDVDSNMIVPMSVFSVDTTRAPEKPY